MLQQKLLLHRSWFTFTSSYPLTEFEQAIPGDTELLPRLGDEGPEPLGNCPGVHGCLEGAEHEVQRVDVVLGFLGNLVF